MPPKRKAEAVIERRSKRVKDKKPAEGSKRTAEKSATRKPVAKRSVARKPGAKKTGASKNTPQEVRKLWALESAKGPEGLTPEYATDNRWTVWISFNDEQLHDECWRQELPEYKVSEPDEPDTFLRATLPRHDLERLLKWSNKRAQLQKMTREQLELEVSFAYTGSKLQTEQEMAVWLAGYWMEWFFAKRETDRIRVESEERPRTAEIDPFLIGASAVQPATGSVALAATQKTTDVETLPLDPLLNKSQYDSNEGSKPHEMQETENDSNDGPVPDSTKSVVELDEEIKALKALMRAKEAETMLALATGFQPSAHDLKQTDDWKGRIERKQETIKTIQSRLNAALVAREIDISRRTYLTGLYETGSEVFMQKNVPGDGNCLWAAFAVALGVGENNWREVKQNAKRMWDTVMKPGSKVHKMRHEMYEAMEANTRNHDLLHWQLQGENVWATVEVLQVLADWYNAEIIIHTPSCPQDGTVHWSMYARGEHGNPDLQQLHLINYPTYQHWTALLPTTSRYFDTVHLARPENSVALHPVPEWFDQRPLPEPLPRTDEHPHASDDENATSDPSGDAASTAGSHAQIQSDDAGEVWEENAKSADVDSLFGDDIVAGEENAAVEGEAKETEAGKGDAA